MQSALADVTPAAGCRAAALTTGEPAAARWLSAFRLPTGISTAFVAHEMGRRLAAHPSASAVITRRYEPTWTEPSNPIATACMAATAEVPGACVRINMRVGAPDARLWRRAGMPTIVCGLTPHNLGASDEHLEIAELPALAAVHALTAARSRLLIDRSSDVRDTSARERRANLAAPDRHLRRND